MLILVGILVSAAQGCASPAGLAASADLDKLPQPRAEVDAPTNGIPRYVLAVIDSSEGRTPTENEIHWVAEHALNYLGYGVHYLDVDKDPLPSDEEMSPYVAILTWFEDGRMRNPEDFITWLEANVSAGRKYILLGSIGTFFDETTRQPLPIQEASKPLQLLGAEYRGNFTDNPAAIEVTHKAADLVEYEVDLDSGLMLYDQVVSIDPANEVWLTLNRPDLAEGSSDTVFVGSHGGYAQQGYIFYEPTFFYRQLRLDLFTFFERALGQGTWPRPDVTTLNGGRTVYTQIDGDGFRNAYESDLSILSSEKIMDEVLRQYPYLATASVVVSDIDPSLGGSPRMELIARELFALDNVEVASHTLTHPFDWRSEALRRPENFAQVGLPEVFQGYANAEVAYQREIQGSIEYINERLAPRGKPVRVFQWSGAANPDAEAIRATEVAGVFNLNGGIGPDEGRWDAEHSSVSWLVPLVGQFDGGLQYYATNPNDNNYTNGWTGPFEGFKNVVHTFERTDSPRRLTPINAYYHFYSGSKDESLSALHQVFSWIDTQETTSVWASEYVSMVQGFLTTTITPTGEGGWLVSNYGSMRTLRFDDPEVRLNLAGSTNVVGYRRINGSLYVFIGGGEEAQIVLEQTKASVPHMEFCGCLVNSRSLEGEAEVFSVSVRLDTDFRLAGVKPETIVSFSLDGAISQTVDAVADADGNVNVRLPKGTHAVEVRGHLKPS